MRSVPAASLWRDPQFRTFWSAQSVSEFGDRITELALPLIAVIIRVRTLDGLQPPD